MKFNLGFLAIYALIIIMGLVSIYSLFAPRLYFGYNFIQTLVLGLVATIFSIENILKMTRGKK